MDDLIIYSSPWEEHVQHVRRVLLCLRGAGLTANPAKCHWGGTRIESWSGRHNVTSLYIMYSSPGRCILFSDRCIRVGNRGCLAGMERGEMGSGGFLESPNSGS